MAERGRPRGPERIPFPLRLQAALLEAVKRCAAADVRSINAEIEVLLREALQRRGVPIKARDQQEAMAARRREPPAR
jgi:hypothetical protein